MNAQTEIQLHDLTKLNLVKEIKLIVLTFGTILYYKTSVSKYNI